MSSLEAVDCHFRYNLGTPVGVGGKAITILGCTFLENDAGAGISRTGAVSAYVRNDVPGARMLIADCLFAGNVGGRCGALFLCSASFTSEPSPYYVVSDCTFVGNATSEYGGAIRAGDNVQAIVSNSILWGNAAGLGGSQLAFAPCGAGVTYSVTVEYSDVQGGAGAAYVSSGTLVWGAGNSDQDPLFADLDGPDDDPDTWFDNDLRPGPFSPCVDAADNFRVPPDVLELDGDGDTSEPLPFDLDGNPRFLDDPMVSDTGNGSPPIVDMGAYEKLP